jgi:uncharacterized protein YdhG (YjbR/CyaY superfamily)
LAPVEEARDHAGQDQPMAGGHENAMSVDDYLDEAPEPQRSTLMVLRSTLRDLLPEAAEAMSYGMPAFLVDGKPVAGYAWAKGHCSYHPHSGAVLSELAGRLDGYDWSKGTLRFPVDEPLPRKLVARLVEVKLEHLKSG